MLALIRYKDAHAYFNEEGVADLSWHIQPQPEPECLSESLFLPLEDISWWLHTSCPSPGFFLAILRSHSGEYSAFRIAGTGSSSTNEGKTVLTFSTAVAEQCAIDADFRLTLPGATAPLRLKSVVLASNGSDAGCALLMHYQKELQYSYSGTDNDVLLVKCSSVPEGLALAVTGCSQTLPTFGSAFTLPTSCRSLTWP